MSVQAYLEEERRLDQQINEDLRMLEKMKAGICSRSYPQENEEQTQTAESRDTWIKKAIQGVAEMEKKIDWQIDRLVDLRRQISGMSRCHEGRKIS